MHPVSSDMAKEQKTPIRLGRLLGKHVSAISISSFSSIHDWSIIDYPTIVVWEASMNPATELVQSLFRFWIEHSTRTFVLGGYFSMKTEDMILNEWERMKMEQHLDDDILTYDWLSLPEAIWCGGFMGYIDTPNNVDPIVCVMLFGSVARIRRARECVRKMENGWIPKMSHRMGPESCWET